MSENDTDTFVIKTKTGQVIDKSRFKKVGTLKQSRELIDSIKNKNLEKESGSKNVASNHEGNDESESVKSSRYKEASQAEVVPKTQKRRYKETKKEDGKPTNQKRRYKSKSRGKNSILLSAVMVVLLTVLMVIYVVYLYNKFQNM